jgi:hypothetical protein
MISYYCSLQKPGRRYDMQLNKPQPMSQTDDDMELRS